MRVAAVLVASGTLLLGGIGLTGAARGNGPEISWDGSVIVPVGSTIVQLVGEEVMVDLEGSGYPGGRVHVTYWLRNPGSKTETIQMSFLVGPQFPEDWYDDRINKYDFEVSDVVGLIPIAYHATNHEAWREFGLAERDTLPVWTLHLGAGTTSRINMSYAVQWGGGGEGPETIREFRYVARPARLWAGRLEFARFSIRTQYLPELLPDGPPGLRECDEVTVSPAGWYVDAGAIHWRYEDWEPDQDIILSMTCRERRGTSSFVHSGMTEWMSSGPNGGSVPVPNEVASGSYDGDRRRYVEAQLLEEMAAQFARLRPASRRPANYLPFAVAWITWRRNEIDARRGRRFADPVLQSTFTEQNWYAPTDDWQNYRRGPIEQANFEMLRDLEMAVIRNPGLLPPVRFAAPGKE